MDPHLLPEIPRHVAIIMDGNGRWAKSRLLPRIEGHRAGAKTVRMVVEESRRAGIRYLTLFSFSTENWLRPQEEVSALMKLFEQYLEIELSKLVENDIRLRAVGDLERLPESVRSILDRVMQTTAGHQGMDLILAVSYGGRSELVHAVRAIARAIEQGRLSSDEITPETISGCLYAPDVPDPDLLIRTSSEHRISNFLLWQMAYTEFVVSELNWPEFSRDEFMRCLQEFAKRKRRFGRTGEQVGGE